jgi:GTP cyclohydrolase I
MYLVIAAGNAVYPNTRFSVAENKTEADVFIDDLIDSGATKKKFRKHYPATPFYALYNKLQDADKDKGWLIFPWESTEHDDASAEDVPTRLLQYIGEDVQRGGLVETPKRFLKAWDHWTSGMDKDPADILKTFEDGAEKCDEMVLVKNIPAYSKCEHHLADIFGVAHVAYIPDGRIVGLSKLNRLVDMYGRRLQVQERWTNQVADALEKHLKPKGVAVIIEARHMCMESRGVCQQGHSTVTSAMRGVFRESQNTRSEFMGLIK